MKIQRLSFVPSTRSGLAQALLAWSFVLLGAVGLVSPFVYNIAPASGVFEAVFFATAIIAARPLKRQPFLFFMTAGAYVLIKMLLMIEFNRSNLLDFLQAYKAFIYIMPLCLFIGWRRFDYTRLAVLVKVLLWFFLIKYGYSRIFDFDARMHARPGLYVENNFELIGLIGLFYLSFRHFGQSASAYFGLLFLIVALSGSRSALLAMLVLYVCLYMNKLSAKVVFYFGCFAALAGLAGAIFYSRMDGDVESIDRYKFWLVFLYEIRDWGWENFAFGSFPITPLSPLSCSSLSFYSDLFSRSGNGACYSVILHSFILRVIFDQGLLGLAFLSWFSWYGLAAAGHSLRSRICILGVITVSSLSVSAFNSVFVAILLAFAFGGEVSRVTKTAFVLSEPRADVSP